MSGKIFYWPPKTRKLHTTSFHLQLLACLYAASLACAGGAERSTALCECLSALLACGVAAPVALRWGWHPDGWVRGPPGGWADGDGCAAVHAVSQAGRLA